MYQRRFGGQRRERSVVDVERHLDDALNGDLDFVQRIRALWSLESAGASWGISGRGQPELPLASLIGSLLGHPKPLLAREAFEVLCTLDFRRQQAAALHDDPAELSFAVGVDKEGRLAISRRLFADCEPFAPFRAWCPDLDVEVVPLIDLPLLAPKLSTPPGLLAGLRPSAVLLKSGSLRRIAGANLLSTSIASPMLRREGRHWRLEAQDNTPFTFDDVKTVRAEVTGHHAVHWNDGSGELILLYEVPDTNRVIVEQPNGATGSISDGDAWFSPLPHARGHVALFGDAIHVVDTTATMPAVATLRAGDVSTFGVYRISFDENGRFVRIGAHRDDGPTKSTTKAANVAAASSKKAA